MSALWRRVDWGARRRKARELLERCGAEIAPERTVRTLSMPEQQTRGDRQGDRRAGKILILDEPTASLTDREVERLFRVIETLRGEGVGIIYISHRLDEVAAIADRVTVLRDGQSIATRDLCDVDRAELIRLMVGRDIHAIFPKREVPIGEVALEVRSSAAARRASATSLSRCAAARFWASRDWWGRGGPNWRRRCSD